jgi:hypothetical protein
MGQGDGSHDRGEWVSEALPDDVLLELGKMTWAAINLEDVVYEVCRAVRPRGNLYDSTPIGSRIDQAVKDLADRPDDELKANTRAWLVEAKGALIERNSVL